eukprot:TRINITY_DN3793_c0_g1_i8.p1 TRINITY_DN3793_c0_g1~~TRINITY_DN3793_c0_g1_i8.p1  ORF type:complete len:1006 (+),score=181.74 TRINITY_DN3793_c0_g1_i8:39-3020(+)
MFPAMWRSRIPPGVAAGGRPALSCRRRQGRFVLLGDEQLRAFAVTGGGKLAEKRRGQAVKLAALPEVRRRAEFRAHLAAGANHGNVGKGLDVATLGPSYDAAGLSAEDVRLALDAGLITFLMHAESRVANHCGEGFYTIGPCGEELLSGVALALRDDDAVALHYRHLSTLLARALRGGKPLKQVLLDRARGFCVSTLDPAGGGHHCLLGGGPSDFLVSSTLASQAPAAVGRAAGLRLAPHLGLAAERIRLPAKAVSYVSLGDGSVNNAHFLTATNLSEYMQHRGFQCPVVFGISNNDMCISLRGHGWLRHFTEQRLGMPVFRADGNSLADVFQATRAASEHARRRRAPSTVVFDNLSRRFGHAATDRQEAYLTPEEIETAEATCSLFSECERAVKAGLATFPELLARFDELATLIEEAFDVASAEPKVSSREAIIGFNSQPLVPKTEVVAATAAIATAAAKSAAARPKSPSEVTVASPVTSGDKEVCAETSGESGGGSTGAPLVMRRCMTRAIDEQLSQRPELVYIGEDVEHGGYYRVTEGLRAKYGLRVADFPPDETALLGVAIGYAQTGLLPIVELPYAKYLDCGADMFFEAVIMNWLSAGKKPCGMVIRLQGFDKGVFGGNFHTHNSLYLPPGLDVVAFSNGADYARGLRHAVAQAAAGRIVMLVDSTDLLNRRHVFPEDRDGGCMRPFPTKPDDVLSFDEVISYGEGSDLAIVTYGNGVPTALRAQRRLREAHDLKGVVVVDAPYLSQVPTGLAELLPHFGAALFADVCKLGQHPHAGFVVELQDRGLLPTKWRSIGAARTYNPLGSTVTFLSDDDIVEGALAAIGSAGIKGPAEGGASGTEAQGGGAGGEKGKDQRAAEKGTEAEGGGAGGEKGKDQRAAEGGGGAGGEKGKDQRAAEQGGGAGGEKGKDQRAAERGGTEAEGGGAGGEKGKDQRAAERGGGAGGQKGKDQRAAEKGGGAGGEKGKDQRAAERGGESSSWWRRMFSGR